MRIGTVIPSTYVPPYIPPPPPPPDPDPDSVYEAKRRSAMQTQSLLFDRASGWTVEKAKAWAKKHGHKTNKVDVTDRYIRLRQIDPKGFTVKRTVPFGKGIRAVVAREENMAAKKKTTRRPASKRTSAKRKSTAKPKAALKRRTAPRSKPRSRPRSKKTSVVTARRRPYRTRETRRVTTESRRRPRRVRETPVAAEARRRKPARRKSGAASYVMAKRRRPRRPRKVRAWSGDSAGRAAGVRRAAETDDPRSRRPGDRHACTL